MATRNRIAQYHPRGRWRSKKQTLRALAHSLGYPDCLAVTTEWDIEGWVGAAGVRLREFRKLHRHRQHPRDAKHDRQLDRSQRRASRRGSDGIPF